MEKTKSEEEPIKYELTDVKFDFYSPEEVKKISIKPITSPMVYNTLGLPERGSLHDPSMGVSAFDRTSNCEICNQNAENCTGHFGHIDLHVPLYHPFLLNQILKILNAKCFNCHKLKMSKKDVSYLFMKLFLIKLGFYQEAAGINELMYESFNESTEKINEGIIKFLKDNIATNKEFFDDIKEENEEQNEEGEEEGSENEKEEKEKKEEKREKGEKDKKKNDKKKKKKKEEEEKKKANEYVKKITFQKKFKILKELMEKIKLKQKSIYKNKPQHLEISSLNEMTMIKDYEVEFWKMTKLNKCANCGATSAKYKKINNVRFFQVLHSEKEKKRMEKSGIDTQKDALEHGAAVRMVKKMKNNKEKILKKLNAPLNEFTTKDNETIKKKKKTIEDMDIDEIPLEEAEEMEIDEEENENEDIIKKQKFLHCYEVKEHLIKLFNSDCGLLSLFYGTLEYNEKAKGYISISSNAPDFFFITTLIVPPNRFRPENQLQGEGGAYLHQQTALYTKIVSINNDIKELSKKVEEIKQFASNEEDASLTTNRNTSYFEDIVTKWIQLQGVVNVLFDSTKAISRKEQEGKGIRQLIEKKQGILRMKTMGKRVNHAGRTVISPDPNIGTDEVGIPLVIASKLYYPEKVTKFNIESLKKLVERGPFKYPGANQAISEDGRVISLANVKDDYRKHIAENLKIGQIVNRHMQNGDILLLNRQPTLHKPSIMGHQAKILPKEKTFRFHYSNCSSYNADFDGDEMNIHFLQGELARVEGYHIAISNNQYTVPTSGKPIRGLIQDSVDSSVYLTMKDTFFSKEEYCQLVYMALDKALNAKKIRKIVTVAPAIIKPKILYTGKQIITSIISSLCTSELVDHIENAKVTFEHNTKLGKDLWGKGHEMEGTIIVKDNEMLTGVLDKNDIGASDFGLIHSLHEIYGGELTGQLITTLGKLYVNYLQSYHGFTCSVRDIILNDESNLKRRVDIEKMLMKGMDSLGKFLEVNDFNLELDNYSRRSVYSKQTDKVEMIIKNSKYSKEEKKEIKKIVQLQDMKIDNSLFKYYSQQKANDQNNNEYNNKYNGSYLKIKQLRDKYESIVLQDDSLEVNIDTAVKNALNEQTSNVPKNWLGKGLIYPFPNNTFAMMVRSGSKGSMVNMTLVTCLLGQQELEGRRVPRMASGRTLPSFEPFDPNPRAGGYITDRFSTGIRPQEFFFHCMSGREGLIDTAVKTSRSGYLQRCLMKHLEQLIVGYDYTVRDNDGNIIQFYYGEDSIDTMKTKYLTNFKFITENIEAYLQILKPERLEGVIDTSSVKKAISNKEISKDETLLNKFEPWKYLGAISEQLYEKMINYLNNDPDGKFKKDDNTNSNNNSNNKSKKASRNRTKFKNVIYLKYLNSLIQPGETVGVLAAQSVGEPSTQMTLNTFHLAGHGGANVTLGIPRLREILMTSEKNIKTPIMTLPLFTKDKYEVKRIARRFENYNLIDVIKKIKMKQSVKFDTNNNDVIMNKLRYYEIIIDLENEDNIKEYFDYNTENILMILKGQFIPTLAKSISRYMRLGNKKSEIIINKVQNEMEKENTDDEVTDTEKYETKRKKRKNNDDDTEENEESESEEEGEEEDETEGENRTYDDTNTNEESEDENKTYDAINTTNEDITYSETQSKIDEKDEKDKKKKSKRDLTFDIINRKSFSFNEVSIENIKYVPHSKTDKEKSFFKFDLFIPFTQKNILLKNILDGVLKKLKFKSVKNIKKCHILTKEKKKGEIEYYLQLEGFNFNEVQKYSDDIDINKIGTNDIGGILQIYGIEACRSSIVKEIVNVFDVYSIDVNKRHLGLIADYITQQGKYRTFSRKGIGYSSSTLLKMTYETTIEFLIDACRSKAYDKCITPSSRIVLGRPPLCGTGSFSLFDKNIYIN